MKIKCSYCGTMIDDANAVCPHCGAPNEGVVRTASSQPVTIEQLKEWYASKGLPPYETTRFFIGEDYRRPRAFGIYKDEKSGNFIVYKNKDSGERAVRYRGTDEAYAVNELYQRLKQEIIQQKGAQQKRTQQKRAQPVRKSSASYKAAPKPKKDLGCLFGCLGSLIGIPVFLFIICLIVVLIQDKPNRGYYNFNGEPYYYYANPSTTVDSDWYYFDENTDGWYGAITGDDVPKPLRKNKTAKEYFLSEQWSPSVPATDFTETELYGARLLAYEDEQNHHKVSTGYYSHPDGTYYHLSDDSTSGWYSYDYDNNDWTAVDSESVPEELLHESLAQDFFFVPVWDGTTQISDFTDTQEYADYTEAQSRSSSSSSSSSGSSWDDDDDYDYSWSSSDSWDSYDTDWDSDW